MKNLFFALLTLCLLQTAALADDLPSIRRNPAPPASDAETRLRFIENTLGIDRISWTCHVPQGWRVTFTLFNGAGQMKLWKFTYDGNALPQQTIPDLFMARVAEPGKDKASLTFGSSLGTQTIALAQNGSVSVRLPESNGALKYNLFEFNDADSAKNGKPPKVWVEVLFEKIGSK